MQKLPEAEAEAIRRNPPHVLSLPEAAAFLTISPRKLWEIVHRPGSSLRAAKFGRRLVLRLADLNRYLELQVAAAA